jgi:hypothetical protein
VIICVICAICGSNWLFRVEPRSAQRARKEDRGRRWGFCRLCRGWRRSGRVPTADAVGYRLSVLRICGLRSESFRGLVGEVLGVAAEELLGVVGKVQMLTSFPASKASSGTAAAWNWWVLRIEAIRAGREPECSGRNGAWAVEMVSGVYATALHGGWAEFPVAGRGHPLGQGRERAPGSDGCPPRVLSASIHPFQRSDHQRVRMPGYLAMVSSAVMIGRE